MRIIKAEMKRVIRRKGRQSKLYVRLFTRDYTVSSFNDITSFDSSSLETTPRETPIHLAAAVRLLNLATVFPSTVLY